MDDKKMIIKRLKHEKEDLEKTHETEFKKEQIIREKWVHRYEDKVRELEEYKTKLHESREESIKLDLEKSKITNKAKNSINVIPLLPSRSVKSPPRAWSPRTPKSLT